jgi:hypothetical protein
MHCYYRHDAAKYISGASTGFRLKLMDNWPARQWTADHRHCSKGSARLDFSTRAIEDRSGGYAINALLSSAFGRRLRAIVRFLMVGGTSSRCALAVYLGLGSF